MRAYSGRQVVLVAGGARRLRYRPCDRQVAEGADMLCVDAFLAGTRENIVRPVGHPTSA